MCAVEKKDKFARNFNIGYDKASIWLFFDLIDEILLAAAKKKESSLSTPCDMWMLQESEMCVSAAVRATEQVVGVLQTCAKRCSEKLSGGFSSSSQQPKFPKASNNHL